MGAIGLRRIYRRARDVLESIHFGGLTFRDFLRPEPRRVVYILSAIVNYLHFRHEKLALLNPIVQEFSGVEERLTDARARIAELQKVKEDHAYKEQMDEPAVQQLQAEVNALKQKIQEYNTKQLALRSRAKAIDEKKEGILAKISQADFELMKHSQENSKLLSKIVQSPEKLQKNLEEKKGVRDELKTLEKMAMHKVQDKNNTLEMYAKVCEKLSKHLSKIDALHETV
jgi:kinetochore protein Nuf2